MSEVVSCKPSERTATEKPRVLVMMATYNGERYLAEQIDSILAQEGVDVSLVIRDDCSTDGTAGVCWEHEAADARVRFRANEGNLGVGRNFMQMVAEADAGAFDFFAFSDQDDVWLPGKLARATEVIRAREAGPEARRPEGAGVPVLYASDLQNVDANLSSPRRELVRLHPDLARRATPLLRNIYSGCTMVMNREMLQLLQSHGCAEMDYPRIHDAWCAMVAYYCGNLALDMESALILRRITGDNSEGATLPGKDVRRASLLHLRNPSARAVSASARNLLLYFSDCLAPEDKSLVASLARYADNPLLRLRWALSRKYRMPTIGENVLARIKFLLGRY